MVFKWNDQDTLLFLKNFKKYECLWNRRIAEYKDRPRRVHAMKSLIKDLNIEGVTVVDIKHKIKTIRTRYTAELIKIRESTKNGCSSDDVYVPTLYWFKQAEFLSSVCFPRHSTSLVIAGNKDNSREQLQDLQVPQNEGFVEVQMNDYQAAHAADDDEQKPTIDDSEPQTTFFSARPLQLKRKNQETVDKTLKEISEEKNVQTEDEFDLFCRSLAVQLKKMPLDRALICQQKLQYVMTQERLKYINDSRRDPLENQR